MNNVGFNRLALLWIMSASLLSGSLFIWPLHVVMVAGQNASLSIGLGLLWAMALVAMTPFSGNLGCTWVTPVYPRSRPCPLPHYMGH